MSDFLCAVFGFGRGLGRPKICRRPTQEHPAAREKKTSDAHGKKIVAGNKIRHSLL